MAATKSAGSVSAPVAAAVTSPGRARRRKPSIRSTAASASAREPSWYSIVER